jgi:hypothetical protein
MSHAHHVRWEQQIATPIAEYNTAGGSGVAHRPVARRDAGNRPDRSRRAEPHLPLESV